MNDLAIKKVAENNKEFRELVGSRFFSVTFIKKDGSERTYKSARLDVKKHTKGGQNTVEHKPNLITIYEMHSKQYRTLDIDKIIKIKF